MLAPIRLSRLSSSVEITDDKRRATNLFLRYFNDLLQQVERAFRAVIEAQETGDQAIEDALVAFGAAELAQDSADAAQVTADSKLSQSDGDARYVRQDVTPVWTAPASTGSRASLPSYTAPTISNPPTQAEVQAVANAVQATNQRLSALITDLIANGALSS